MIFANVQLFKTPFFILIAIAITGMVLLNSCSSDDATGPQGPQIVEIAISPDNATFAVGEQLDFTVFALTATGDTLDTNGLDIEWQWWSTDADVFTVEAGGLATGQNPGEAYCVVEAIINVAQLNTDVPNDLIVQTGILRDATRHQDLSAVNNDVIAKFETISMNNMLRFTGRDSAFVMIF